MHRSQGHPTLEYTRSVCTCGKELSTLFYRLTNRDQFREFSTMVKLTDADVDNIGFVMMTEEEPKISFCCLMTLRFGNRVSVASATDFDAGQSTFSSHKYPTALPGPLSKEKILTWF